MQVSISRGKIVAYTHNSWLLEKISGGWKMNRMSEMKKYAKKESNDLIYTLTGQLWSGLADWRIRGYFLELESDVAETLF